MNTTHHRCPSRLSRALQGAENSVVLEQLEIETVTHELSHTLSHRLIQSNGGKRGGVERVPLPAEARTLNRTNLVFSAVILAQQVYHVRRETGQSI